MFQAALILTILAAGLPVAAVVWAWQIAHERAGKLDGWIERTVQLSGRPPEEHAKPGQGTNEILQREGIPTSTMANLTTIRLIIQKYIITEALPSLSGPAIVGAIGFACGVAASLMSLPS